MGYIQKKEMPTDLKQYLNIINSYTKPNNTGVEATRSKGIDISTVDWNGEVRNNFESTTQTAVDSILSSVEAANTLVDKANVVYDKLQPNLTRLDELIKIYNSKVDTYNQLVRQEQLEKEEQLEL